MNIDNQTEINGMDFWWKKTLRAKKIIKGLLEDLGESSCTCGAESDCSDQSCFTSGCFYHEALEFIK